MRLGVIFVLLVVISGCAATGPMYQDHVRALNPLEPNKARLVVFRTTETLQYSARSTRIKLDNETIGNCDYGGYKDFDVNAGKHMISVDLPDFPGRCGLAIEVTSGNEYYFELKPRAESFRAGLAGAFLGGLVGMAEPVVVVFTVRGVLGAR